MNPGRHLFLDLEETIVDPLYSGWACTNIINVQKITDLISAFNPDEVHLFSFAVWNQQELVKFNEHLRPHIEKTFGFSFSGTWTVDDDILPLCTAQMRLGNYSVSFSDMVDFWGKQHSFKLAMRQTFLNSAHDSCTEVMLVDDIVHNETFFWPDYKLTGKIVDVNSL
jgi:hypothetical protein